MAYDTQKVKSGRKPVKTVDLLLDQCPFTMGIIQSNEILYSEDFSTWGTVGTPVVTDNAIIAPDGTVTGAKIEDDDTGGACLIFTTATAYTERRCSSIWVKKGDQSICTFNPYRSGDTENNYYFNFDDPEASIFSGAAGSTYGYEAYPDGWFRIWVSYQTTTTGTTYIRFWPCDRNTASLTGYTYAWGAQHEYGEFPVPYLKTTGTSRWNQGCGAGENGFSRSEAFDHADWTKLNATITANQSANPIDYRINADLLDDASTSHAGNVQQPVAVPVDTLARTVSIFAKAGTSNYVYIYASYWGGTTLEYTTRFNLTTGEATDHAGAPVDANVEAVHAIPYGDGWWRVGVTLRNNGTAGSTTFATAFLPTSFTVTETGNIYIWGAQYCEGVDMGIYANTAASARTGTPVAIGSECYNTRATCQSPEDYEKLQKAYSFADIPIVAEPFIPCVKSVSTAPTKLNPSKGIGERASISVNFNDLTHSDIGIDPYYKTRNYTPLEQGTFWGKLQARNPYHYGRRCILKTGYLDDDERYDEANFESRYYIIESINGPDSSGMVRLVAKDILKLADDATAQCPAPSNSSLSSNLASGGGASISLQTGEGANFPSSGRVRINQELIDYTTNSSDTLGGLTRGVAGSENSTHDSGDSVQLCYVVNGANVTDVIYDLLVNYADVPSSYINTTDWNTEETDWLGSYNLHRTISEPEGVNKLLSQIAVECNLDLWWDDVDQEIKLQAIVPPRYTPETVNDNYHLLTDTISVKDVEKDRISQVWLYYAMRNQVDGDKTDNYARLYIKQDASAEGADLYNKKRAKIIRSYWFDSSNEAVVKTTANRILARFNKTPKQVEFSLDAKDSSFKTGELITLNTKRLQGIDGANLDYNLAIVSRQEITTGTTYKYKAITSQWNGERYAYIGPSSLTNTYATATDLEKNSYSFISQADGEMSNGDEGYNII